MIHGVAVYPLRQISDARGKVMHMLRNDAAHFTSFGEIYFSTVNPGQVKAWHVHRRMVLNYAVPSGKILLVLYDHRRGSPTRGEVQEIPMGDDNYCLVTVPPRVWNGFTVRGGSPAIVANCASIPHDSKEIKRLDPRHKSIPYRWPETP